MRISDWSSDVCSSDLVRDALLARFDHDVGGGPIDRSELQDHGRREQRQQDRQTDDRPAAPRQSPKQLADIVADARQSTGRRTDSGIARRSLIGGDVASHSPVPSWALPLVLPAAPPPPEETFGPPSHNPP